MSRLFASIYLLHGQPVALGAAWGPHRTSKEKMDADSDSSTDVSVHGQAGSPEDRRLDIDEWWRRVELINRDGLNVTLVLDPLPEDPDLYLPATAYEWIDDVNHENRGYWRQKPPVLLQIRTRFPPGAVTLSDRPRRRGEAPYHISLCFTNELHRFNLFDESEGINRGKAMYNRIRERYDGHRVNLPGRMQGGMFELKGRDIANDAEVQAVHACGAYHDRSLHIRM